MNVLYLRIKALADERKLSLAQIERELDLSNGIISSWKKGKASSDNLLKLSNYFHVSTDYLLGKTEIRDQSDTKAYFRLDTDGLTDEEIQTLKTQIEIAEQIALKNLKDRN